ncbi:dihydrofolate reductase family protein [Actinokineospora xionganensis]|uniref:Dihydrofolate reductase n=1 Tax=Actinokineospora xionganensis TaxID=2684470 RepID=A0ABR7LE71_9PSEU|nr:dihydrofolate reductase family protein [Actinokineospora xionganensis]MBC6450917.1 dihydrofolate reductase [Actinokineospora xionganensis]
MGIVVFDITVSLDGYITAPGDDQEFPLGPDGECLHDWVSASGPRGDAVLGALFTETGAVIAGRRTYDNSEGPNGWGTGPLGEVPVFVLTHKAPEREDPGVFTFVTDGIESALAQARAVAGDKDVYVMGGADVGRQYLAAGLLDEVRLHMVPVVLGGGVRLFGDAPEQVGLEISRVVPGDGVTHLSYRVTRTEPRTA